MLALLQTIGEFLLAGIAILAIIGGRIWHHLKAEQMLREWSEREGHEWIESEYRSGGLQNPYSGLFSGKEAVFRVTVKDASGAVRSGWVRLGGMFLGLSSDEVAVTWDPEGS